MLRQKLKTKEIYYLAAVMQRNPNQTKRKYEWGLFLISNICELVDIGKNCFIGHGVMFINDKFKNGKPAQGNKSNWQNTKIASNVYIGSNSTILPVKICSNVVIGAGSVVTKDISKPGNYAGNPAKKI